MQRKSKPPRSNAFEDWASPELQAAFAEPLRTAGEPLRRVLDTREVRLACSHLLSRHRDGTRAYRYPGLWRKGRRCWVAGDTQEERVVSLVLFALVAPHAPGLTVKQRKAQVAKLRAAGKAHADLDVKALEMLPAYPRERKDPQVRSAVVVVAGEALQLFSGPLFGCVANLLNAVYGRKVCTARDVKRWWHDEPKDEKVGT